MFAEKILIMETLMLAAGLDELRGRGEWLRIIASKKEE